MKIISKIKKIMKKLESLCKVNANLEGVHLNSVWQSNY